MVCPDGLIYNGFMVDHFDSVESSIFNHWFLTKPKIKLFDDIDLLKQVGLKRLFQAVFTNPSNSIYSLATALSDFETSESFNFR